MTSGNLLLTFVYMHILSHLNVIRNVRWAVVFFFIFFIERFCVFAQIGVSNVLLSPHRFRLKIYNF